MLLKSYKSNERFLAATSFVRPPQCVDGNSNANFLIMPATTALTYRDCSYRDCSYRDCSYRDCSYRDCSHQDESHQVRANQSYHRFFGRFIYSHDLVKDYTSGGWACWLKFFNRRTSNYPQRVDEHTDGA